MKKTEKKILEFCQTKKTIIDIQKHQAMNYFTNEMIKALLNKLLKEVKIIKFYSGKSVYYEYLTI